jgi:hydrogenase/urease accessory protein HupE
MMRLIPFFSIFLLLCVDSSAHEVRPALLKVTEVSANQFLISWKVPAMGNQRLSIDPIFNLQCIDAEDQVNGFAAGASVRSWTIECSEGLTDTDIQFSNLSSTMIDVLVQVTFLDGRYYTGLVRPNSPSFHVPKKGSQASIFQSYLLLGIEHILFGWDHLLFVLALIIMITDNRRLLWAITGFTAAHSVTLALATLSIIHVPGPPVEAVIALSIVLLAVETRRYRQTTEETFSIRSPWLVSVAIGFVHGLGFAGALSEFGLPAHAKFVSLLAFNLGVETGQLIFIAALLLVGVVARRYAQAMVYPIQTTAVWFVGVCGSFWLVERVTGFFYV